MFNNTQRILITPGEPAGIGPDITIQIAQREWPCELVAIADPTLLQERAKQMGLPLTISEVDVDSPPETHQPGKMKIVPIRLTARAVAGTVNPHNANYVLNTLRKAASLCQSKLAHAIVTGPVHKAVINQAGIAFAGHTEFFADYCEVPQTVMLFVVGPLKIALVTTHLPLADVPKAITQKRLERILTVLQKGLQQQFKINTPNILVCGLNPHAGEDGYLGHEEIDTITPLLNKLRQQGYHLKGPLSADTIFTPKYTEHADAILAMYHDQALPLVKYLGFGQSVNVTLGLPFLRTSVDHGTALDIAGTGKSNPGSMRAAIELAMTL